MMDATNNVAPDVFIGRYPSVFFYPKINRTEPAYGPEPIADDNRDPET